RPEYQKRKDEICPFSSLAFLQPTTVDKEPILNIKSEQNQLSDTQNSVLFAFLSNLSILKIYNKEFLKSKSFYSRLFSFKPNTFYKHF
ncbi:hypothetical protein, partial [Streptococcus pneumoniae]|uniref:hypothetical protein n=1 Tax=Streptococcus pneumoniae TaxID=1313 RepID=UPI001E4C1695